MYAIKIEPFDLYNQQKKRENSPRRDRERERREHECKFMYIFTQRNIQLRKTTASIV